MFIFMFRSWMTLPLNYLLLGSITTRRYHTTFVVLMCSATRVPHINIRTRGGMWDLRRTQMQSMFSFSPSQLTSNVFLCMYNATLICVTFKCRRFVGLLFNADAVFFKNFEAKSYQLEDDVSQLFLIFNYLA